MTPTDELMVRLDKVACDIADIITHYLMARQATGDAPYFSVMRVQRDKPPSYFWRVLGERDVGGPFDSEIAAMLDALDQGYIFPAPARRELVTRIEPSPNYSGEIEF